MIHVEIPNLPFFSRLTKTKSKDCLIELAIGLYADCLLIWELHFFLNPMMFLIMQNVILVGGIHNALTSVMRIKLAEIDSKSHEERCVFRK